jgi:hypothetical protein
MTDPSDLFDRVLMGQLRLDSEELLRLRIEAPNAARELDELLALHGELDARGPNVHDAEPTQADRDLVAATLRRVRAGTGLGRTEVAPLAPPPATRPRAGVWILRFAAAALIVALAAAGLRSWHDNDPDDIPLGGTTTLHAVSPVGTVAALTEFRLRGDLSEMAHYELRIWSLDASVGSRPIQDLNLTEHPWEPSATFVEGLPDDFRWQIVAFDRFGKEIGRTEQVEVRRRP